MWTTLAAAGIAAATSIAGGIIKSRRARDAANQQQSELNKLKQDNENFYRSNYYSDVTDRADVRSMLTEAQDKLMRANKSAEGRAAVMGASNSTTAAMKEANNETYAGLVRGVMANAQSRKDALQDKYMQNKTGLANAQMSVTQSRNDANAAAIDSGVAGVNAMAQGIASYYGGVGGDGGVKKPSNTGSTNDGKTVK